MQTADELVDLGTARRTLIPRRDGTPISPSTIWRWIRQGINGVRLEVVYVGATPHTSQDRVDRFFASVTAKRLAAMQDGRGTVLTATEAELREARLV